LEDSENNNRLNRKLTVPNLKDTKFEN